MPMSGRSRFSSIVLLISRFNSRRNLSIIAFSPCDLAISFAAADSFQSIVDLCMANDPDLAWDFLSPFLPEISSMQYTMLQFLVQLYHHPFDTARAYKFSRLMNCKG